MARLTWEQVQAPDMDLRGLAQAGATITNSFDRVAALLNERYTQQRTAATDAAIAQQLALTDPDKIGKIDLATLDPKVDKRALMAAAVDYRRGLTQELGMKEDLLNKQAATLFGADIVPLLKAAYNGDEVAQAQLAARSADDPMFARFMAGQGVETFKAYQDGADDREANRVHDANIADAAVGRSLERTRIGQEGQNITLRRQAQKFAQNEKKGAMSAIDFGRDYALTHSAQTEQQGLNSLLKNPKYQAFNAEQREFARKGFLADHGTLSASTAGELAGSMISARTGPQVAELRTLSNASQALGAKADMDTVLTTMTEGSLTYPKTTAKADINSWLAKVPGSTLADFQVVLQSTGYTPGMVAKYLGSATDKGEAKRLYDKFEAVVGQRKTDEATAKYLQVHQQVLGYQADGKEAPAWLVKIQDDLAKQAGITRRKAAGTTESW